MKGYPKTAGKEKDMRQLSLASGTLPEFDPATVVEAASAAGFDGCGIWYDPKTWTPAIARDTRRAFQATGLKPLEIEVIVVGDPARAASHEPLLDAGAALGATEVIVVSVEPDIGRCAELIGALNEQAKARAIHLCLEFLPIFAVTDLRSARAIVDQVADDNLKILLDPLHVARSGLDLLQLAELPPGCLSFAQFCDAPAAAPGDGGFDALYDEALNGRLLPGEGELPLAELLAALPAELPLSLEMRAAWLRDRHPDPVQRAALVAQSTRDWLAAHGDSNGG